jgi:hypothetical protein
MTESSAEMSCVGVSPTTRTAGCSWYVAAMRLSVGYGR